MAKSFLDLKGAEHAERKDDGVSRGEKISTLERFEQNDYIEQKHNCNVLSTFFRFDFPGNYKCGVQVQ